MKKLVLSMLAVVVMLTACGKTGDELTISGLNKEHFVSEVEGHPTALYVLTNGRGMEVCITNYGGRIVSVMVPDKNGKMTDVVLGYDKKFPIIWRRTETSGRLSGGMETGSQMLRLA